MKRAVLVLCFLLLLAAPSFASEYEGCCEDGYTYRGGYWWLGECAYTRCKTFSNYYWYCGQYIPRYYSYVYTKSYCKEPKTTTVSAADPNWRSTLAEIAKYKVEVEGKLRLSANEQNQFIEAVRELKLDELSWSPLTPTLASPYRGYYPSAQIGTYGAQGNTIYGYRQENLDVYGSNDTNLMIQQAAALAKDSLTAGSQAVQQFQGVLEQRDSRLGKVAEIIAQGRSAQMVLEASKAAPSVQYQSQVRGGTGALAAPSPLSGALVKQSLCANCHNAMVDPAKNAGFVMFDKDMNPVPLSPEQEDRCWRMIASGTMPKDKKCTDMERQALLYLFKRKTQ